VLTDLLTTIIMHTTGMLQLRMLPKYLKHSLFSSCFWPIIFVTGDGCLEMCMCIGKIVSRLCGLTEILLQQLSGIKAIPLQALTGPDGSSSLRLPDLRQSAHEGGKVVSPMHLPLLTPRIYSWYSFLLEAD
jgi:hypothetical protein